MRVLSFLDCRANGSDLHDLLPPTSLEALLRRAFREDHVRRAGRGHVLGALVAELGQIKAREQIFTLAEQDRRDGQVQLIDQPGLQVLPHRRDAAADPHSAFKINKLAPTLFPVPSPHRGEDFSAEKPPRFRRAEGVRPKHVNILA